VRLKISISPDMSASTGAKSVQPYSAVACNY
jgi:hypothetical protein